MSSRRKSALEGALGGLDIPPAAPPKRRATKSAKKPAATTSKATPAKPTKSRLRHGMVETSLYLPEEGMWQIKELALLDRKRPHDLFIEALDEYCAKRGRPTITELRDKLTKNTDIDE